MILLIFGEENFLSLKKAQQIKERFSADSEEANINEIEAKEFSFSEFVKLSSSLPFISKKRLIIIKDILSSKINKDEEKKIAEYLSKIPEYSITLFYENVASFNNKILAQKVMSLAQKSWDFKKMTSKKVEEWLNEEVRKRKISITKPAFSKLLAFVGNNLWQLDKELDKLSAYKNKERVEENDIEDLVSANLNTNVFELIDNIGAKNTKGTLSILNNLIEEGEDPLYLLGMIIYQIRNLLIIEDLALKNTSKSEIIKKTGKHPYVVTKTLIQAKNFSLKELENIYSKIFETELSIKTGRVKPKTALNILVTKLCTKR